MNKLTLLACAFISITVHAQNVGIGTTTPAALLHVRSTGFVSEMLRIEGPNPSYMSIYESGTYRGYLGSYSGNAEDVDFGTGGLTTGKLHLTIQAIPRLTISNTGNAGIGTTNPLFKLDVRNGSINTDSVYRIGTTTVLMVRGTNNLFIGKYAGNSNTGSNNTFSGDQAGYNNTIGNNNSFFGQLTGYSNTEGTSNSFFGTFAGEDNTTGNDNSFFGLASGDLNREGSYNSFFGRLAGYLNTSGSFNTVIGASADVNSGNLTNATAIGAGAGVNASYKIRLGSASVTIVEGAATYTVSDGRFKSDVSNSVPGLDFILALNPVSYRFQARKFDEFLMQNQQEKIKILDGLDYSHAEQRIHNGFIAQEVEQLLQSKGYQFGAVHAPTNPTDNYSIAYAEFVVPLVKAVQEQQVLIEKMQKRIEELEKGK